MSNINESLSHHGVPGQRWGFRRFQNRDGSLTPAGRRRAQKLKNDYKQLTGKKLKGKIPDEDPSTKKIRDLSDTQLKDRINRLRSEKEAHSLEKDLSSNGQKFMRSVGRDVLAPAAINAGRNIMEKVFYSSMSKALGMDKKEVKSSYEKLKEEANIAKFKEQKMKSEKWMKEELERQKNKQNASNENNNNQKNKNSNSNDSQNKKSSNTYNFNIYNMSSKEKYYDDGKKVYDTVYEEKPSNKSTALITYDSNTRKKGKSLFDDLYN